MTYQKVCHAEEHLSNVLEKEWKNSSLDPFRMTNYVDIFSNVEKDNFHPSPDCRGILFCRGKSDDKKDIAESGIKLQIKII